ESQTLYTNNNSNGGIRNYQQLPNGFSYSYTPDYKQAVGLGAIDDGCKEDQPPYPSL
ncbi:MAG: hypothetical protein QG673_295, partial [Pseudomonadota bacterium]|nr:hypothetical protein [Pseudomonadota bacterium]